MINRPIYVDKIMAYADMSFVKILTGIRRCGKSTILKMLIDGMKERGLLAVHLQKYTPDEVYVIVRDIYNSTIFLIL